MVAARAPVIDLTLLDPSNPRLVAFQFDQIEGHLDAMPHMSTFLGRSEPIETREELPS